MRTFLLLSFLFVLISGFTLKQNAFETISVAKSRIIIKLYPNPSYDGSITISSTSADALQFYVFDVDGKLLHQLTLKDREKQMITGLKKGTYMYNVLNKDEIVDGGKIIVK